MPATQALLVFPHQLFQSNATLAQELGQVFLIEEPLYFTQYRFHRQKLVLHRASIKAHAEYLGRVGRVDYIEVGQAGTTHAQLTRIRAAGIARLHYIDVVDDWLEQRLLQAAQELGLALVQHDTAMFMTPLGTLTRHFSKTRSAMSRFYASQRLAHDILIEEERPLGGKWSFDAENRKKLPRNALVRASWTPPANHYVDEAQRYVDGHFPRNPGSLEPFDYPVTYVDAQRWLEDFIEHRLPKFGDYEDAISSQHAHLYHSVLTPMLNIGVLTPHQVLKAALARSHHVPLNSLEGFVRQVLGWREYVRGAYRFKGRAERTRNFWGHARPLPEGFWRANVGIEPIDEIIAKVLRTGYAHHIERLMVLANFMLLCEFNPDEVYRWFMELFIDAYDWVMVPNVYGMGLYADGGAITTKPYICGSNYLLKMSDWRKGPWCPIWDGLYWRFVAKHRTIFAANPRLQMSVRAFDRMPAAKRESHLAVAERFLSEMDSGR